MHLADSYLTKVEEKEGEVELAIAHHSFLNPLVMVDVMKARKAAGKTVIPIVCYLHGTALKMYKNEKAHKDGKPFKDEYWLRFLPMMQEEAVFESADMIACCVAISEQVKETFIGIFPNYPANRILVCPNGVNNLIFHPQPDLTPAAILPTFSTAFVESPVTLPSRADHVVVFVGKFADWKRLDAVLYAAEKYEKWAHSKGKSIVTIVAGTGPGDAPQKMVKFVESLSVKNVFLVGPQSQRRLAELYSIADVGVFPSFQEPQGLVFVECMACGTPVIGANSGGPSNFVTPAMGSLVAENITESKQLMDVTKTKELASLINTTVIKSIDESWKKTKKDAALGFASSMTIKAQCSSLKNFIDKKIV